jgi:hypothetical protein
VELTNDCRTAVDTDLASVEKQSVEVRGKVKKRIQILNALYLFHAVYRIQIPMRLQAAGMLMTEACLQMAPTVIPVVTVTFNLTLYLWLVPIYPPQRGEGFDVSLGAKNYRRSGIYTEAETETEAKKFFFC